MKIDPKLPQLFNLRQHFHLFPEGCHPRKIQLRTLKREYQ